MSVKYCRKCSVKLIPEVNWTKGMIKKNDYLCRDCHNQSAKEYALNNPDKIKEYEQKRYQKNKEKIKAKVKKWESENRERVRKRCRIYYKNNREKELKRFKKLYYKDHAKRKRYKREWSAKNLDKIYEYERRRLDKLLKLNPKLTHKKRSTWGHLIRLKECKDGFNYYKNYHAHHIMPVLLCPNDALEEWNGVPLPAHWHYEFHGLHGRRTNDVIDPRIDWPGELFDFIDMKIKKSNKDLTTLDDWLNL